MTLFSFYYCLDQNTWIHIPIIKYFPRFVRHTCYPISGTLLIQMNPYSVNPYTYTHVTHDLLFRPWTTQQRFISVGTPPSRRHRVGTDNKSLHSVPVKIFYFIFFFLFFRYRYSYVHNYLLYTPRRIKCRSDKVIIYFLFNTLLIFALWNTVCLYGFKFPNFGDLYIYMQYLYL